jgi:hypothetical protein
MVPRGEFGVCRPRAGTNPVIFPRGSSTLSPNSNSEHKTALYPSISRMASATSFRLLRLSMAIFCILR